MRWIYDMPTWLFCLSTVTVFVGLALGGLFAVHEQFHRRRSLAATLVDNEVVACFFQSLLVLYGITLGLIAVAHLGKRLTSGRDRLR
jgi:hypothetical protein